MMGKRPPVKLGLGRTALYGSTPRWAWARRVAKAGWAVVCTRYIWMSRK